ncbi:MAG: hypothetical protein AAF514_07795, partial [Verrucomicrobiota bacterium]
GLFEIFQNFTLAEDASILFGASFSNREGHAGDPSTVGIYDAEGTTLLSPEVSVDTSGDPIPSDSWRSGEASVSLPAGEYQIRIALNNFNNVDAVFATASGGADGGGPKERPSPIERVGIQPGGNFGITIPEGETVDIEYSVDLVDWEVIATDVTGAIEETDAERAARRKGFYRATIR